MGAQLLLTRMTMGPLVVFSFTRYTGGALALSVAGFIRLGPAAFVAALAAGAALVPALGAGAADLVCANAAHNAASIIVSVSKTFFISAAIILTRIANSDSDAKHRSDGLHPFGKSHFLSITGMPPSVGCKVLVGGGYDDELKVGGRGAEDRTGTAGMIIAGD